MQATSTDRWVACAARSVAGSERARARRRVKDMRAPRVSKATPIARQLLTPVRAWLALHVFGEGVFVVVAIVAGSHVRRAGTCASARRRCCSPPTSPRLPEGMRRTRRYGGSLIAAARGQRQRRARMPAAVRACACERGTNCLCLCAPPAAFPVVKAYRTRILHLLCLRRIAVCALVSLTGEPFAPRRRGQG